MFNLTIITQSDYNDFYIVQRVIDKIWNTFFNNIFSFYLACLIFKKTFAPKIMWYLSLKCIFLIAIMILFLFLHIVIEERVS